MYLFIYDGYKKKDMTSDQLIKKVLYIFKENIFKENTFADSGKSLSWEILRTEKGRPFFKNAPVAFSVSHSGNLWVCLMNKGKETVGVDVQKIDGRDHGKLVERYFSTNEKSLLKNKDNKRVFAEIWTRKEALAKALGTGLTGEVLSYDTASACNAIFDTEKKQDGNAIFFNGAADDIVHRKNCIFKNIYISEDYACTCFIPDRSYDIKKINISRQ